MGLDAGYSLMFTMQADGKIKMCPQSSSHGKKGGDHCALSTLVELLLGVNISHLCQVKRATLALTGEVF